MPEFLLILRRLAFRVLRRLKRIVWRGYGFVKTKLPTRRINNIKSVNSNTLISVFSFSKTSFSGQSMQLLKPLENPKDWRGKTKYLLVWNAEIPKRELVEMSVIKAEYEQLDILLLTDFSKKRLCGLVVSNKNFSNLNDLTSLNQILDELAQVSLQKLRIGHINTGLKNNKLKQIPQNLLLLADQLRPAKIIQPNMNLLSQKFINNKEQILIAMPFFSIGGAPKLMLGVAGYLYNQDIGITVVARNALKENQGNISKSFEKSSDFIATYLEYFNDESLLGAFFEYLITSRNIKMIINSGFSSLYPLLPMLKNRFPRLKIIDQQYNLVGHMADNQKYANYIDITNSDNLNVINYLKQSGRTKEQLSHIPNGVDLNLYSINKNRKSIVHLIPKKYDVKDKLICAFFGRLSEEKAPDRFLDIAKATLEKRQDIFFILAGDGDMREKLEKQIKEDGLDTHVFMPGFVDAKDYLSIVDIVVIPSRFDGFPISALEALASGTPIVASRVGGLPEIVEVGVCGSTVDYNDVNGFVEAIGEYKDNGNKLILNSKDARRRAEENYSLDKTHLRYYKLISNEYE